MKTRQCFLCKLSEGAFYVPILSPASLLCPLCATLSLVYPHDCSDGELSTFSLPKPGPDRTHQVQTGPTSSWSPGCTEMFDTQQQETCRATPERKGEVKTHSLLCHSVSPVSKYCSLHLNLIGLSLGIHYLHLLLVSPYQQMPT